MKRLPAAGDDGPGWINEQTVLCEAFFEEATPFIGIFREPRPAVDGAGLVERGHVHDDTEWRVLGLADHVLRFLVAA